jgi:LmbE family N-acetylglucosaminyl deacetylase
MSRAVSDPRDHLPPWRSVLAVVAHPGDESFALGAVLAGFADAGAAVAVLCYTHGESSTLHGVQGDLAGKVGADGLMVFDTSGVTGHPDHARATVAALAAADGLGLPVLGWTVPTTVATVLNQEYGAGFTGHDLGDVDLLVTVDRPSQLAAVACHPSQAVPGSLLWRRLELLGDVENLRWLRPPHTHHQKDVTHS